jgi:hypothetical protein
MEMIMHATIEEPISKQQIGKNTTIGILSETAFSVQSMQSVYIDRVS